MFILGNQGNGKLHGLDILKSKQNIIIIIQMNIISMNVGKTILIRVKLDLIEKGTKFTGSTKLGI